MKDKPNAAEVGLAMGQLGCGLVVATISLILILAFGLLLLTALFG